jgi:hypothetical protein
MQRSAIVTTAYSPTCNDWNAGIAFLILNDLRFNNFWKAIVVALFPDSPVIRSYCTGLSHWAGIRYYRVYLTPFLCAWGGLFGAVPVWKLCQSYMRTTK